MLKDNTNIRGSILIELIIKSYSKEFLEIFFIFFKQRFFKNFIKSQNKKIIFNRYTLLRSSFVNKKSREQIEKRIYKKKINLIFSDFEFKSFYTNLNSLNFKGISLKFFKYFFTSKKILNKEQDNQLRIQHFKYFWNNLNFIKKQKIITKYNKNNLHQVFPLLGLNEKVSKLVSLKFLKSKALKKNRLKKGLFKKLIQKPNLFDQKNIKRKFYIIKSKRKTSFIFNKFNLISLCYCYNFLNDLGNYHIEYYNKKLKYKSVINSISRYKNFFLPSFLNNNRKRNDYRGGLYRLNLIDKFNLNFKLVIGLKLNLVSFKQNYFFKNNFTFLFNEDRKLFLLMKKLNKDNISELNKIIYVKSLISQKESFKKIIKHLNKIQDINKTFSTNPWLVRRYFFQNLSIFSKNKFEKNIFFKSIQNSLYFRYKPLYFFILLYKNKIKNSNKKHKAHLKKRLKYLLKRNWRISRRIKIKNRFFFKKRLKKKNWKFFNHNLKNKLKKKIKNKFKRNKFRINLKNKKRFNTLFAIKY